MQPGLGAWCHHNVAFTGMSRKGAPAPAAPLPDLTTTKEVINALKQLYMEKMRPIEVAYNFAEVCGA